MEVSFCITCGDRRPFAEQTLPQNLRTSAGWDVEFVLLDYSSSDGLGEFVRSIHDDRLRYIRHDTSEPFHASRAKNLAHRNAKGRVVCNLDVDNLLLPESYDELCNIDDTYILHGFNRRRVRRDIANGPSVFMSDGSYGRISMTMKTFLDLRGYDESMRRMGYQDTDLLLRAEYNGYRVVMSAVHSPTIMHPKDEGWHEMLKQNQEIGADSSRKVNQGGFGGAQ